MGSLRWAIALLFAWVTGGRAELVAAAVLPHGDFAFDPRLLSDPDAREKAERLRAGSLAAGKLITDSKPDVVVMTTPHGLQTSWDVGVYQNAMLSGDATVGRDLEESFGRPFPKQLYHKYLDAQTDGTLAQEIVDGLANATLLRGWNGILPLPLHWGEVLALEYLSSGNTSNDAYHADPAGVVVGPRKLAPSLVALGLPLSRYNFSSSVAAGFRRMGQQLGRVLRASSDRIALVVSTDLAHTHWPNTSFGFSADAAPFDRAVGRWAASLDETPLMVESAASVDHVYSCGWLGLVLLHGALEASAMHPSRSAPLNASWSPTVTAAPEHPTYYGMLAAAYTRKRKAAAHWLNKAAASQVGAADGMHASTNAALARSFPAHTPSTYALPNHVPIAEARTGRVVRAGDNLQQVLNQLAADRLQNRQAAADAMAVVTLAAGTHRVSHLSCRDHPRPQHPCTCRLSPRTGLTQVWPFRALSNPVPTPPSILTRCVLLFASTQPIRDLGLSVLTPVRPSAVASPCVAGRHLPPLLAF